jgi:hypothetical protein
MQHQKTGAGQRICITGGVINRIINRRLDISMQSDDDRERTSAAWGTFMNPYMVSPSLG